MNDEHDQLGAQVKRVLETEARQLTLAPDTRRTIIAAAKTERAGGWDWLWNHKRVCAGAACVVIMLAVIFPALREEIALPPKPYMEMHTEVLGGPADRYERGVGAGEQDRNQRG